MQTANPPIRAASAFGAKCPEPRTADGVVSGFPSGPQWNPMEPAREEGTMWIAVFSIAAAAAICLSVAAVMVQSRQGDTLRG